MPIKNLQETEFSGFIGKNTDDNTVKTAPEYLLAAKNVVCQGDDTVKLCDGYTTIMEAAGKIIRTFDCPRPADKKQFLIVQHDAKLEIALQNDDGTYGDLEQLTAGEDDAFSFDFITSYFAAYGSNGKRAYRIMDVNGVQVAFNWGIAAPKTAPAISFSPGSQTLQYGRKYCMSFVSYVTDSSGTQRMHIGPPGPLSVHTGPQTSEVPVLEDLEISDDPQVTHKWIFSTVDTPDDTSSTFYFEAEITNATTSFGDTLTDNDLDTTRLAPFDNNPAPEGSIVLAYQNRAVVIDPDSGFVFFSGFEEIQLGDPMAAFPADLFFQLPAGTRKPTGAAVVDDGNTLLIGTEEAWTKLTGSSASDFAMKERVISPGPCGKDGTVRTPTHLVWLSRDKKINAWDTRLEGVIGVPAMPIDLSQPIQQKLAGTYSMEDLKDSELPNAKLAWFAYGKKHYLLVAANTIDEPTSALNWVQLWYVAFENGQIKSLGETDFIPTDLFSSVAVVMLGPTSFVLFGGFKSGKVYRWPDGFMHDGEAHESMMGLSWSLCEFEGSKQFYFADIITDRMDAAQAFKVEAVVSDTPNMLIHPVLLENQPIPGGGDPMGFRVGMMVQGVAFGTYARLLISFPDDGQQATVKKITIYARPIYQGAP